MKYTYLLLALVLSCTQNVNQKANSIVFKSSSFNDLDDDANIEDVVIDYANDDFHKNIEADSLLRFYETDFLYEVYRLKTNNKAKYLRIKTNRVPPGEIIATIMGEKGEKLAEVSHPWYNEYDVKFLPLFKGDSPMLVVKYDYMGIGRNANYSSIYELISEQKLVEKAKIIDRSSSIPPELSSIVYGEFEQTNWKPIKLNGNRLLECHQMIRRSEKPNEWGEKDGVLIKDTIFYIPLINKK